MVGLVKHIDGKSLRIFILPRGGSNSYGLDLARKVWRFGFGFLRSFFCIFLEDIGVLSLVEEVDLSLGVLSGDSGRMITSLVLVV